MEILSERDTITLEAISRHYEQTGFSMSLAEAAEAMGMSKGSVIADSFKRLEAAGYLVYSENRKQCIPTNWKEIITSSISKQLEEATKAINDMNKAKADLDKFREKNKQRQAAYAKRQKKKKSKGV